MLVHKIDGKLTVNWNEDVKAIVDVWEHYGITLDEFKTAVLKKGLTYASARKGVAWIVDSSNAKGVFSQEIQQFIGNELFPAFAKNGIKYFITITSKISSVTKLTVKNYSEKLGPNGIKLVEVDSLEDAISWLKLQK